MNIERFIAGQRKGVNLTFAMFVALLSMMWVAAICDWAFNLGWGWDRQIIWLAPPMMLGAAFVRFCCMAIFKFVSGNFNGS
jgi:hypothetical protein